MEIFAEKSYKSILRKTIEAKKAILGAEAFNYQALAAASRIQKTYLSRVLNGDGQLSSDQLFLALAYLEFSAEEKNYITLLHQWERSEISERRKILEEELRQFRQVHMKTERHLKDSSQLMNDVDMTMYYLNVNTQLVHMFLTIPQYANSPTSIAKVLGISEQALTKIMRFLAELKIINYKNHRVVVERTNLHLSKDAPLSLPYRTMMRLKALERLQSQKTSEPYGYSLFFSADEDARAKVQALFFEFLKAAERVIGPAKCKNVYQLQFDLIDWSET